VESDAENPAQHLGNQFDPTDYGVFQTVFGMIFTVIIMPRVQALPAGGWRSGATVSVQVRSVILIGVAGGGTQLIILDLSSTDAIPSAGARRGILALGAVYWLVRDQGQPREIIARETD